MDKYIIYTDGCCLGNGKEDARGGWAFVIYNEKKETLAYGRGHQDHTTNNRMELTAASMALSTLKKLDMEEKEVILYSDSAYMINCRKQKWYKSWENNGWITSKKTPVENKDLWVDLIPYFEKENYTFEKVKGHVGVMGNEICDSLAKVGAQKEETVIYVGSNYSCI